MPWYHGDTLTVTHLTTGECATVSLTIARSMFKAKKTATSILRGRLWCEQNGMGRKLEIITDTELPDHDLFPHELSDYRKKLDCPHPERACQWCFGCEFCRQQQIPLAQGEENG